jgi:SAM-dependent methyltransferase
MSAHSLETQAAQGIAVFDRLAREYDQWFDDHPEVYRAEVETLRRLLPSSGDGVEIGAGTGRFAVPLGAMLGIEPSWPMARIAQARGLTTVQAVGEHLPLPDGRFDFALLVTVICFVADLPTLLRETGCILKPGGRVVIGMIDLDTPLGWLYESRRGTNPFYRHAHFHTASGVIDMLERTGFRDPVAWQAMIDPPGERPQVDVPIRPGYGEGSFVGIGASWSPRSAYAFAARPPFSA